MKELPIDPELPRIVETLSRARNLVLEAPPGAGKTTRVPRALLDAGLAEKGEIVVLEPRRLAARLAARRVAEELGEKPGQTVGYTMRFEDESSPKTRIRFVTEGVLTRRLVRDPSLEGVAVVVLDEFHERSLQADVALALLRRLQAEREDLHLVVMSATLESRTIADFLDAPVVKTSGRAFDVDVEYLPKSDDRPLERIVKSTLFDLLRAGLDGDVLVFLPGMLEIRRAAEACAPLAKEADLLIVPLHGSLSPAEQDVAVGPSSRRKVVLATNVAETSITIDGITVVIDSGLANIASSSPWSGLPVLETKRIARSSAIQRAGRAGRTRPGRCLRLYTRGDFETRPAAESPEIARADLADTALELHHATHSSDLSAFPWFEAPSRAALDAAEALLEKLGAIDSMHTVTDIGKRMLRFPTHPRLSRIVVECERQGVAVDGCALAALLGERDLGTRPRRSDMKHGSDVLELLASFEEAESVRFAPDRLLRMGIDPGRANTVRRVRDKLRSLADTRSPGPETSAARERALQRSVLVGYPDRVGRLRRPAHATGRSTREIAFAAGGTAALSESSGVADVDLVVAVDVEERSSGKRDRTLVRMASGIEEDDLLELFTDRIRDEKLAVWNAERERVDVVRRLSYDGLVLEEVRANDGDPEQVANVLAAAVRAKGWRSFARGDALDQWLLRLSFARKSCPELDLPAIDEASIEPLLAELCAGCASFEELVQRDLGSALEAHLSHTQRSALAEVAPEHVTLPGGRRLRINYAADGPPFVESRLQDFFGMQRGPVVAKGRVPLLVHLLAPNQRAVQVTTDLEGFWKKHYPAIARELRRRYPKHGFPDDPATATPPKPKR